MMMDIQDLKEFVNREALLEKKVKSGCEDDNEFSTSPKHILDDSLELDSSLKRSGCESPTENKAKKIKANSELSYIEEAAKHSDNEVMRKKMRKKLKKLTREQIEDMMAEIAVEYLTTNRPIIGEMRQKMESYKTEIERYEKEFFLLKEQHSGLTAQLRQCIAWSEANNPPVRVKKVRSVGVQRNASNKQSVSVGATNGFPQKTKYMISQQTNHVNAQQIKPMNAQKMNRMNAHQTKYMHIQPIIQTKHTLERANNISPVPTPSESPCKSPPPRLSLSVQGDVNGIYINWTFNGSLSQFAPIQKYQLYVDPEATGINPIWRKIGDIEPKPLPMKCTIKYNENFSTDKKYDFKIRAVDVHSRMGEFSNTGSICLPQ